MASPPQDARQKLLNGIPHAATGDRWTRQMHFHTMKGLLPLRRALALVLLVTGVDVGYIVVIVLIDETDFLQKARERAYRESAAAEAEQENRVARHVVVDDEA